MTLPILHRCPNFASGITRTLVAACPLAHKIKMYGCSCSKGTGTIECSARSFRRFSIPCFSDFRCGKAAPSRTGPIRRLLDLTAIPIFSTNVP